MTTVAWFQKIILLNLLFLNYYILNAYRYEKKSAKE